MNLKLYILFIVFLSINTFANDEDKNKTERSENITLEGEYTVDVENKADTRSDEEVLSTNSKDIQADVSKSNTKEDLLTQLKDGELNFNRKASQKLLKLRYSDDGVTMGQSTQKNILEYYTQITKILFSGKYKIQRANWAASYLLDHLNEVVLKAVRDAFKENRIKDFFLDLIFKNQMRKIIATEHEKNKTEKVQSFEEKLEKFEEEKALKSEQDRIRAAEIALEKELEVARSQLINNATNLGTPTKSKELFDQILESAQKQKMEKSRIDYITEKAINDPNIYFLTELLKSLESGKLKDNFWTDISWFDFSFKSKIDRLAQSAKTRVQNELAIARQKKQEIIDNEKSIEEANKENVQFDLARIDEEKLKDELKIMNDSLSKIISSERVGKFFKKYQFDYIQAKFFNTLLTEQKIEADNFHQAAKLSLRIRNELDAEMALEIASKRPDRKYSEYNNKNFTKAMNAIIKYERNHRTYMASLCKHILVALDEKQLVIFLNGRRFKRLAEEVHFNEGYLNSVKILMNYFSPTKAFIYANKLISHDQATFLDELKNDNKKYELTKFANYLIKYPEFVKTKYDLLKFEKIIADTPYSRVTGLKSERDIEILEIYQDKKLDVNHFKRRFLSGDHETSEFLKLAEELSKNKIDIQHMKNLVYASEFEQEKNEELKVICEKTNLDYDETKRIISSANLEMSDSAYIVLRKLLSLEFDSGVMKKSFVITVDTMDLLLKGFKSPGSEKMYEEIINIDKNFIKKYFKLISYSDVSDHTRFVRLREAKLSPSFILEKMATAPRDVELIELGVGASDVIAKYLSSKPKYIKLFLDTIGSFQTAEARNAFIAIFHKKGSYDKAQKYVGLLSAHQFNRLSIAYILDLALKGYLVMHINVKIKSKALYYNAIIDMNPNQINIVDAFYEREDKYKESIVENNIEAIKALVTNIPAVDNMGITSALISLIKDLDNNYFEVMEMGIIIANLETVEQVRLFETLYNIKKSSNLDIKQFKSLFNRNINPNALKSIESVSRKGFEFIPDIELYLSLNLPEQARIIERFSEYEINPSKYLIDINKIGSYESQSEKIKCIETALEFALPVYYNKGLLEIILDHILNLEDMEQEKLYELALHSYGDKEHLDKLSQSLDSIRDVGKDKNKIEILKLFIGGNLEFKTLKSFLGSREVTSGQVKLLQQFHEKRDTALISSITRLESESVLSYLLELDILKPILRDDIQALDDHEIERLEERVRGEIPLTNILISPENFRDGQVKKARNDAQNKLIEILGDIQCERIMKK